MVVALDLSEYSEIVLEHALDQAARHSSPDLHFLHVIDDEGNIDAAKQQLAKLVLDSLPMLRKVDWRARLHVRAGRADEEIVALAAELDAHLIVIGRFGVHHGIAHRVLDNATCPTLAVNLVDRPIPQPQCPACMQVREETDGERWFCDEHSAPDRVTLATVFVPDATLGRGGGPLW